MPIVVGAQTLDRRAAAFATDTGPVISTITFIDGTRFNPGEVQLSI